MKNLYKILLFQENPIVGDIEGNMLKLRNAYRDADIQGANLLIASELFLSGYPPEDLLGRSSFLCSVKHYGELLVQETKNNSCALVFGLPWAEEGKIYNSVMVAQNGTYTLRHKVHLPNEGVFDEPRFFTSGDLPEPVDIGGLVVGLPICKDIWFEDVCTHLQNSGAEILITLNASPFTVDKHNMRLVEGKRNCLTTGLPLIYLNQVGGQDELVFDGSSFVMTEEGEVVVQLPSWRAETFMTQWVKEQDTLSCVSHLLCETNTVLESMYQAMVLSLRDYVYKNGFSSVLLGLSGGIDSALCAGVAVDALGAEKVHCIMLPSIFTSQSSLDDARILASNLGVKLDEVSIKEMVSSMEMALAPLFVEKECDVTEENIQSRLRGVVLMAISNKFGSLLLTTGNKSELSVGYATLYGDMNGGYNPLKDIYKTKVFALTKWRNQYFPEGALGERGAVFPNNIIEKPPSAELRANQKDDDILPSYDILDEILCLYIEENLSVKEIVAKGYTSGTVEWIENMLHMSEYKRKQSAPGVKIGSWHFGKDRRYPLTHKFRDIEKEED